MSSDSSADPPSYARERKDGEATYASSSTAPTASIAAAVASEHAVFTDGPAPIEEELAPFSSVVDSMLTDLYQITMTYAYWKAERQDEHRSEREQ